MARIGMNFDPRTVKPDAGGERPDPIPAGTYNMMVVSSDVRPNKNGTGAILELRLEVIDGPNRHDQIVQYLNIEHEKAQVQAIGQAQLSALMHAAGIMTAISDSEDLHGQPFSADVIIEASKDPQYGPSNRIKKYHPYSGAAKPAQQQSAAPVQRNRGAWR